MSIFKKLRENYLVATKPSTPQREDFTPDNSLDVLKSYNENSTIKAIALDDDWQFRDDTREWLLNSFYYAAGEADPKDILKIADYMNESDVFNAMAPQFYDSATVWDRIYGTMFTRAVPEDRPNLLMKFEKNGHMQEMVSDRGAQAAGLYRQIVEGLPEADRATFLYRSESYQLAKDSQSFKEQVAEYNAYDI